MKTESTTVTCVPASKGISCCKCGSQRFIVLYTRKVHGGMLRRRRECLNCGHRLTTHEVAI